MGWRVEFHPAFATEFLDLDPAVQDEALALVELLKMLGPRLKRPHSDTLSGSEHANMKELRFAAAGGVWRIAYAFDPGRKAILLVAGDKSGEAFLRDAHRESRRASSSASEICSNFGAVCMTKPYRAVPSEEIVERLSPERRARIAARASELLSEQMTLREIRKLRALTQEDVAKSLGGKQVYVSRIEQRADVKLSTLRDYVQALGGELQLLVTFPDDRTVRIGELGDAEGRSRTRGKRKTAA
jgi:hypothetical protein